jgi:hypothetical protein
MIVQNCNLLLVVITKIELLISEQKTQHPELSDEDIIEFLKYNVLIHNKVLLRS